MSLNIHDTPIKINADSHDVNRALIEKALAMRCSSYLSQVKANLLTDIIFGMDESKKSLSKVNFRLQQEIIDRKHAEEKLRKARDEAERANCLKDKFIALVSHDLKSPINGIMGSLQLIQINQECTKISNDLISLGIGSCKEMINLIDEILNLSKIKNGRVCLELTCFSTHEAANLVIEKNACEANKKGVELINEIDQNIKINADHGLLSEVIHNLISNAIKFCAKGDKIWIKSTLEESTLITVTDTGVGIHTERLDTLFQYEEYTSTSGTSGEKGTGLGLPLAKDIIEAHGGHLLVESTLGQGSTFSIKLPVDQNSLVAS